MTYIASDVSYCAFFTYFCQSTIDYKTSTKKKEPSNIIKVPVYEFNIKAFTTLAK
mgnify:CR=1 FL=1